MIERGAEGMRPPRRVSFGCLKRRIRIVSHETPERFPQTAHRLGKTPAEFFHSENVPIR
jgi:hypothetical protein